MDSLLQSIANTTADYRKGEVRPPTPCHVRKWVEQFDQSVRLPILKEMDHVLKKTYISGANVECFMANLVNCNELVKGDPTSFWRNANFLDIQQAGDSQRDFLKILDKVLKNKFGLEVHQCGGGDLFLYIDDVIFNGGRVKSDICAWIKNDAPAKANLYVVVIAMHESSYYTREEIQKCAANSGKAIHIEWKKLKMLENRKKYRSHSDILWPTEVPDDANTKDYVAQIKNLFYRTDRSVGKNEIFSSNEGRQVLEQEFLKAGVCIRKMCPNLPDVENPLGHSFSTTFGFGSTIVTFRNCPNNTPLALWVGYPWYPLFRRKINAETSAGCVHGGSF